MTIIVNGDPRETQDALTLRQLVELYGLVPEKVAIELNRRLVRADRYDLPLNAGDSIEIVTFVGGGA